MTNADVMVQILSEASGRPRSEVAEFVAGLPMVKGNQLNKELTDDEAKRLIDELRPELPGILNWMIEGAKKANGAAGE